MHNLFFFRFARLETPQVRSHAQKYFLKLQKTGGADFIPPARPKRKPSKQPRESVEEVPSDSSAAASAVIRPTPVRSSSQSSHSSHLSHTSLVSANASMFSHWITTNGLVPPPTPVHALFSPPPASPIVPLLSLPVDDITRLRRTQEQFQQAQVYLANVLSAAGPCAPPHGAPQRTLECCIIFVELH